MVGCPAGTAGDLRGLAPAAAGGMLRLQRQALEHSYRGEVPAEGSGAGPGVLAAVGSAASLERAGVC